MKKCILLFILLPLLSQGQTITTIAGSGSSGYGGDGGPAISATLNGPNGIAVDTAGNIYVSDSYNQVIRKITPDGTINTIAGSGSGAFGGDGGSALSASLFVPSGLAIDRAGNLFIADFANQRIRKINTSGIISTYAGNGTAGYSGDSSAATSAKLHNPSYVAVDTIGNLYISDGGNNVIRKVDTTGIITTVAGTSIAGYNGDYIAATNAQLNLPSQLCIDLLGNLYISDKQNQRIRKINSSGIITTIAGDGSSGFGGDGALATAAEFEGPSGITMIKDSFYISDQSNQRIRKIFNDTIKTIAGDGTHGYSGDGGNPLLAEFNNPTALASDKNGNIYICDFFNNSVREIVYHEGLAVTTIQKNDVKIYPNPCSNALIVTTNFAIKNYQIINCNGEILKYTKTSGTLVKIDTSDLCTGLYILKINDCSISNIIKL